MKQLHELLKRCRAAQDELRRLDLMEKEAQTSIENAASEDIGSADVQRKVSHARVALDLVAARRKRLKTPLPEQRDLKAEFRAQSRAWNDRVAAAWRKSEDGLVNATVGWFGGDAKACRRWWKPQFDSLPAFYELRRCFHSFPTSGDPEGIDWVQAVEAFIGMVGRKSKEFEI